MKRDYGAVLSGRDCVRTRPYNQSKAAKSGGMQGRKKVDRENFKCADVNRKR